MSAARGRDTDPRLALPAGERLRVHEIFHSIQGESSFAGRPCVFVRLTGCQMRCSWCDTEYAFYDGAWMSVDEIVAEVGRRDCPLVEVTGGEPLLQPGVHALMRRLCDAGHEVLVETGGGLDITPVDPRVRRILDVKCPGSGEDRSNRWQNLAALRGTDEVKFVLADEADYLWAREIVGRFALVERCPVHFSPVHGRLESGALAAWILRDRLQVRFALQLHKSIWGPDRRGV